MRDGTRTRHHGRASNENNSDEEKKKERRLKTLDEEAVLTAGEKHTSTTLQSFSVERYGKESNT